MLARRQLLATLGTVAIGGCAGDGGGGDDTTTSPSTTGGSGLEVSTPTFDDGGSIPERYTFDGADVSPPIEVQRTPEGATALAIVVDDPDANGFVHWLLWNVPADVGQLPEGIPQTETVSELGGAAQGTNGFGELGYRGPKPPEEDGPHTYRFSVHALDAELEVSPGAERDTLSSSLSGNIIATTRIAGEYER